MKTFLILTMTLVPALGLAEAPKCSTQKITIVGQYGEKGEHASPLLDVWSEASGNLQSVSVDSKNTFTKMVLVLKDDKRKVLSQSEMSFKKNKSDKFDLINEIKKQKTDVESIQVKLYQGNTEFCYEDTAVIKIEDQDAKEVKRGQK